MILEPIGLPTSLQILLGAIVVVGLILEAKTGGTGAGVFCALLLGGAVVFAQRYVDGSLVFVAAALVMALLVWRVPRMRVWRKVVLEDSSSRERGYVSSEERGDLVGRHGVAETALRPAGRASFDGRTLDVVTDGEFIAKGAALTVLKVEGVRVVVKATATTATR